MRATDAELLTVCAVRRPTAQGLVAVPSDRLMQGEASFAALSWPNRPGCPLRWAACSASNSGQQRSTKRLAELRSQKSLPR